MAHSALKIVECAASWFMKFCSDRTPLDFFCRSVQRSFNAGSPNTAREAISCSRRNTLTIMKKIFTKHLLIR